jgi:hypothetical protein
VLFRRRLDLLLQDRAALLTLLVQTAVVAVALGLVFGDLREVGDPLARNHDAITLYFLLGVSCFWFGCNGAVKVIVGDRPIYRRERAVNLSLVGYAASTYAVFCTLATVQGTLLAGTVWGMCHPPGMNLEVFGVLLLASATGTALGLALSAVSSSEGQAVAAVPLALIPQIVFGGVIAKLSGVALAVAKWSVACYWVHQAVTRSLPGEVNVMAGIDGEKPGPAVAAVFAHLIVSAAIAGAVVWVQDTRRRKPQ